MQHSSLRRSFTANVLAFMTLAALIAPAAAGAAGQCSNSQYGLVCQPAVGPISASQTSFAVVWTPGGGVTPQSVALVSGGSAAQGYRDGQQLATAKATAIGFASYQLTVGNRSAAMTYSNLRVVGYWGSAYAASDPFSVTTESGGSGVTTYPVPGVTGGTFAAGKITFSWSSGKDYDFYNVRSETGAVLDANANQTQIDGGQNGVYVAYQNKPGPYSFIVEGCMKNLLGLASSTCSHWSTQEVVTIPSTSAAPAVSTYTWPHLSSGDCELQNGLLTLRSDGSAAFSAQVKTNHTHSGDIWHAELRGWNAANRVAIDFGTLDSVRMSDNHGWYGWNRPFNYDAATYPQITRVTLDKSC